jgi:predicted branched-subunit amino acid permease
MAYLGWTVNTAVGYLAGSLLPVTLQEGMSVALYAMFIGLLVPSVKKHRRALYLAAAAALLNSLLLLWLPPGWAIIAAAAAAVTGLELIEGRMGGPSGEEGNREQSNRETGAVAGEREEAK